MSRRSRDCDISPISSNEVLREVLRRDDCCCIICGTKKDLQIAHYISRARNGLGIPENLVTLCARCHFNYDNGKYHNDHKKRIADYLKANYTNWDKTNLIYEKGNY